MSEDFDAPVRTEPTEVDAGGLIINIEGFEGPLDEIIGAILHCLHRGRYVAIGGDQNNR